MVVRWVWLDLEKKYKRKFLKKGRVKLKKRKRNQIMLACVVGTW
jgi:hypothetical protein